MRKVFNTLLLAGVLLSTSSCVTYYNAGATENPVGSKTGIAKRNIWFGIHTRPLDFGYEAAAKDGNITKIGTYSTGIKQGLFVKRYKTVVTGE